MEKIDLTAGAAGKDAAFDAGRMRAAGLDDASLSELLASSLRPLAALVRDGCGVGFTITGGKANIFGLKDADTAGKEWPVQDAGRPDAPCHIVEYTNYRGETALRSIIPIRLWWGTTEWHPEEQWILTAWDAEKGTVRDFAWQDMRPVQNPATSAAVAARPAVAHALHACRIIDAVIREGHDNLQDIVVHFLTAAEPAEAALRAFSSLPPEA